MNLVERKARYQFAAGQTRHTLFKWSDMGLLAESFLKHPSKMFIIVRKEDTDLSLEAAWGKDC